MHVEVVVGGVYLGAAHWGFLTAGPRAVDTGLVGSDAPKLAIGVYCERHLVLIMAPPHRLVHLVGRPPHTCM